MELSLHPLPAGLTGGAHQANPGLLCCGDLSSRRQAGLRYGRLRESRGPTGAAWRSRTQGSQREEGGAPGGRGRAAERRPGGRGGGRVFPGAFPTRPSDSLGLESSRGPPWTTEGGADQVRAVAWPRGPCSTRSPVGRACRRPRRTARPPGIASWALESPGLCTAAPEPGTPGPARRLQGLPPRNHIPESPGRGLPSADSLFPRRCATCTPVARPPRPEPLNPQTPARTHPGSLDPGGSQISRFRHEV